MSISMKSLKAEIFAAYGKLEVKYEDLRALFEISEENLEISERQLNEAQDEVRRLKARILELEAADFVRGNPEGPTNQAQAWARRLGPGSYVVGYDLNSGERRFWVKRAPRTPNLVGQRLSAEALEEALT